MSNICRFTVPASRDIESIIDYVAGNSSLGAAERLLNKINQKCRTLANFPKKKSRKAKPEAAELEQLSLPGFE
jgi:toxin ParE1/3/4